MTQLRSNRIITCFETSRAISSAIRVPAYNHEAKNSSDNINYTYKTTRKNGCMLVTPDSLNGDAGKNWSYFPSTKEQELMLIQRASNQI